MKPSFSTWLNALDPHDWQNPWCVAGFHQELWTRSQRSYSERAIDKMPQRLCFRSNLSPAAEAAISSHLSTMSWDDVGGLHAVMWNSRRDVSQVEPYRVLQDLTRSYKCIRGHSTWIPLYCMRPACSSLAVQGKDTHALVLEHELSESIGLKLQASNSAICENPAIKGLNFWTTLWPSGTPLHWCVDILLLRKFACRKSQVTMTTSSEAQERLIGWKHFFSWKGNLPWSAVSQFCFSPLAHAAEPFASWIMICTTDRTSIEVAICKDCIRALHCAELGGVGQLRRVFAM